MIHTTQWTTTGNSIRLLLVVLFFLSCKPDPRRYIVQVPIERYLVDSALLPEEIAANSFLSMICAVDSNTLFYLDKEKNLFYYFDVPSNVWIDSVIPLAANIKSFAVRSKDSFYYELDDDKLVTCFNKKQKVYDLAGMVRAIDSNLFVQTITAVQVSNDTIASTARSFINEPDSIPSREDVLGYYDIFYKIENDTIKYIGKYNPNRENLIGQDYFTNLDRDRLMINSSRIVYAYEYRDSLLIYDFNKKTLAYRPVNTYNFKANEPFDNKRLDDAEYANRYLYGQSRLHFLYYDRHQKLIYQYLKHKGEYVTPSGEKNNYYDLPFSLLVYDQDLTIQKELLLGSKKYWPLKTIIKDNGIYIAGHTSTQKNEGKTMFYKFRITPDPVIQ